MDLVALRQVSHSRLLPQCLQRNLRLQAGVNPRLVFFVIARSVYQTERPSSNLPPGPKNGVHFTSVIETLAVIPSPEASAISTVEDRGPKRRTKLANTKINP